MKQLIKKLRKEGHSYGEISNKLNKSKKGVWEIAKDVTFDKKGKERYHNEVKGILKKIKFQKEISLPKIRIIGHLLFDGMLCKSGYHYFARYINTSKELIDQFIKDMKEVYGLNPSGIEIINGKIKCYKVTFVSKELYLDLTKYFKSYHSKDFYPIPFEIVNSNEKNLIEFLRTFWEDEGSITSDKRLMADQKDKRRFFELIELHNKLGLNFKWCSYGDSMYKMYSPKNRDFLTKFYNLKLFDVSNVTRGNYKGIKKINVLKSFLNKEKKEDSLKISPLFGEYRQQHGKLNF